MNNASLPMNQPIIGTRGSRLALWQAHETARLLGGNPTIEVIKTSGDRFLNIPLQGRLEKGFFTKEIEAQLLEGKIDLAVHSLKDLPTQPPPGLALGAYLPRAPLTDLLLVHPDWVDENHLFPVRSGCSVGATSLRRQALMKHWAPEAKADFLRGNVPSRVDKLKNGDFGAILLARAGLQRLALDLAPLAVYELRADLWLPAPGQGAIALQIREGDQDTLRHLEGLDCPATRGAVEIERGLLARYEGGCHTAFGALATPLSDNRWRVAVGLEEEDRWVQTTFEGDLAFCQSRGPANLLLEPLETLADPPLCRPMEPFSPP